MHCPFPDALLPDASESPKLRENAHNPPMSSIDEIIDLYKKDVDRTLIRENLKLTPEERLRKAQQIAKMAEELREAGRAARKKR
jgi:hypothetical protein